MRKRELIPSAGLTLVGLALSACAANGGDATPRPTVDESTERPLLANIGVLLDIKPNTQSNTDRICTNYVDRADPVLMVTGCYKKEQEDAKEIDSSVLVSICYKQEGGNMLMYADEDRLARSRTADRSEDPVLVEQFTLYKDAFVDVRKEPEAKVGNLACAQWVDGKIGEMGTGLEHEIGEYWFHIYEPFVAQ